MTASRTRAARPKAAGPKTAPPTPAPVDGRRARTTRTRDAIVGALLELVAGGEAAPTAAAIAARAKVSVRSIAVHFPTRAALFAAAAGRYHERPMPPEPPASAPVAQRLAALLTTRAVELEASRPIRAAAARLAGEFAVAAEALATSAQRRRDVVARVLHELPVGVVTALLGGPFFLVLLVRGKRRADLWRDG